MGTISEDTLSQSDERKSLHGLWTSRLAFILAATGSAVGLGNIWKFPYMAGENGGAAFVFLYILCILFIGLPVMMAEVMLGRRGRRNPIETFAVVAKEEGLSSRWYLVGAMNILAGLLILSFYSVIAGWSLAYTFRMMGGVFIGLDAQGVAEVFNDLVSDPERLIAWHTVFIVLTVFIISRGVIKGIEKAIRYLMPALFGILLLLVFYAAITSGFSEAVSYLFIPDFSKLLSAQTILAAMGMAFFSLSLAMGAIMMYGSYLPKTVSIAKVSLSVALADTTVALLAGLAIFPVVFANGLETEQGSDLIFTTLPLAFAQMPFGMLVGTLFFLLLVFAAVTSAISLLEPIVAWLVENRKMQRKQAAFWCGSLLWLLGLGTVFSYNLWEEYTWTYELDLHKVKFLLWEDKSFFNVIDFLASDIMLPLGGFFTAIFVAHLMRRSSCEEELALPKKIFTVWYVILRNFTPFIIFIILLNLLGVLT